MMKNIIELILSIGKVDRRWIFLVIALAVLLPLFFPLGLPFAPQTPPSVFTMQLKS